MQGQEENEKDGVGEEIGAEMAVGAEELAGVENAEVAGDVAAGLAPEGKKVDKKKVAIIVAGILLVIGVGVGVWWWRESVKETEMEEIAELTQVYSVDSFEQGSSLANISEEWAEALHDINVLLIPDTREGASVDQKAKHIMEYLASIDDEHTMRARMGAAISYLSMIGGLSHAEHLIAESNGGDAFSKEDKYFYLRGISDYYRAKGDNTNLKRILIEINNYAEEEIDA